MSSEKYYEEFLKANKENYEKLIERQKKLLDKDQKIMEVWLKDQNGY